MTDDELAEMAAEELAAALDLPWTDLRRVTPWGDSFEGFAPSGRQVQVERRYLWTTAPSGDICVEVEVRDPSARTGAEVKAVVTRPR